MTLGEIESSYSLVTGGIVTTATSMYKFTAQITVRHRLDAKELW